MLEENESSLVTKPQHRSQILNTDIHTPSSEIYSAAPPPHCDPSGLYQYVTTGKLCSIRDIHWVAELKTLLISSTDKVVRARHLILCISVFVWTFWREMSLRFIFLCSCKLQGLEFTVPFPPKIYSLHTDTRAQLSRLNNAVMMLLISEGSAQL